ncbi:hypothetical protein KY328_00660 [Candidatus Woesearchaeota archaeon]|nr:hypothetical protein [Candidatus Woesearchaeota archaeon]MBW3021408.1 hypothetical protein [Candidatus Woesearchaeota archaeon]
MALTKLDVFAYVLLSFFMGLFFFMTFYEKLGQWQISLGGIGIVLLAIGYVRVLENGRHRRYEFLEHYNVIIASVVGAVATFYLNVNLGLGPVIAAGVVGVAAVYICKLSRCVKDLPPPAYMGAFVGMSAPFVLSNLWFVGLAGLIAGVVYAISHDVYTGMGGKLGTMAFIGVAIAVFVLGLVL